MFIEAFLHHVPDDYDVNVVFRVNYKVVVKVAMRGVYEAFFNKQQQEYNIRYTIINYHKTLP